MKAGISSKQEIFKIGGLFQRLLASVCFACVIPSLAQQPGAMRWSFPAGAPVDASPAIGPDGTIYAGTSGNGFRSVNYLYAIRADGTQKWIFQVDPLGLGFGLPLSTAAVGNDGTIYVPASDGNLYALSSDGVLLWSKPGNKLAIGQNGTLYVSAASLYALNTDGTQKWVYSNGSAFTLPPAIGTGGQIYAANYVGNGSKLTALSQQGVVLWSFFTTASFLDSAPAIGPDGTVYIGDNSYGLHAIGTNGVEKWQFATGFLGSPIRSAPVVGPGGVVYVASYNYFYNSLYAINSDGSQRWSALYGGGYASPAIGQDGSAYVTYDNTLYALNPDGSTAWTFPTGGSGNFVYSCPTIGTDGTIYVGSENGFLYAISNTNRLASSSWPKYGSDFRNSSRVGGLPTAWTITTSASPTTAGSTSGGGTFLNGQSVTVVATANPGYVFANWSENGTQVSTSVTYLFTAIASRNLVANFLPAPPGGSTITAVSNLGDPYANAVNIVAPSYDPSTGTFSGPTPIVASPFTTGTSFSYELSAVSFIVLVPNVQGAVPITCEARLWRDQSGPPSTLLHTISSTPTINPGFSGILRFQDTGFPLSPRTKYWLSLQSLTASTASGIFNGGPDLTASAAYSTPIDWVADFSMLLSLDDGATWGRYWMTNLPPYSLQYSVEVTAPFTNALPVGWREAIELQPSERTYGICPVRQTGKDSLILITHGWQPWPFSPDVSFIDDMSNAITGYLQTQAHTNWQVCGYNWLPNARTALPGDALNNATQEGIHLGNCVSTQGWSRVHLIAHSAGSELIQTVTELLNTHSPSTMVQCTFLDPFVGYNYAGVTNYGRTATWAESYFSSNTFVDLLGPVTDTPLIHAYNVDVTHLDPAKVTNYFEFASAPCVGCLDFCYQTYSTHGWPIVFYSNTIAGTVSSNYDGFGFPLSMEAANWAYATNSYMEGSTTNIGGADPACLPPIQFIISQTAPSALVNFAGALTVWRSTDGTIQPTSNSLQLTTGSPVWIGFAVTFTNLVNLISFDAQFISTAGALGLLSIYWDSNKIGSVDEIAVGATLRHYSVSFPNAFAGTIHVLGFRLDAFGTASSSVILSNAVISLTGVEQPFSLAVTTNLFEGGLPLLRFTGQPGFKYGIQASTNLVNWEQITTVINTSGDVEFYDSEAKKYGRRFYRAIAPSY